MLSLDTNRELSHLEVGNRCYCTSLVRSWEAKKPLFWVMVEKLLESRKNCPTSQIWQEGSRELLCATLK